MARIIIGGDVCATGANEDPFRRGDAALLFRDLLADIQSADLSIVNLESPLIRHPRPAKKSGPVLGVGRECVNGLAAANSRSSFVNCSRCALSAGKQPSSGSAIRTGR